MAVRAPTTDRLDLSSPKPTQVSTEALRLVGDVRTGTVLYAVERSLSIRPESAKHNVKAHRTGVKHLRHPLVGDLYLPYEALELSADPSLRINVYTPEPDSEEQSKLALLASWSQVPAIAVAPSEGA